MFLLGLATILCGAAIIGMTFIPQQTTNPQETVSLGEVTDLITRLRPLAKDSTHRYGGLSVIFYGAGVKIELERPNGNKYVGEATTLVEAVARIMTPAEDVRAALDGWHIAPIVGKQQP